MIEHEYSDFAKELRQQGKLVDAGEYYVASSFGYLMKYRVIDESKFESSLSPTKLGFFHRNLILGSLCYRLAGELSRTKSYCQLGIIIVKDVLLHDEAILSPEPGPPTGLCHEMIGDFELVGQLDSFDESYENAEMNFRMTDNHIGWSAEPEFELVINTFIELADGVGYEIPENEKGRIRHWSLINRIHLKRDHYRAIIEKVLDVGNWESDKM